MSLLPMRLSSSPAPAGRVATAVLVAPAGSVAPRHAEAPRVARPAKGASAAPAVGVAKVAPEVAARVAGASGSSRPAHRAIPDAPTRRSPTRQADQADWAEPVP